MSKSYVDVALTDLLDEAILENLKNSDNDKKYYPLRPSNAGKCPRQLAYALAEYEGLGTYEKELLKPEVYRLLSLGSSVEWSYLKNYELVKDLKIKYKQQTVSLFKLEDVIKADGTIIKGPLIEGSCDALMQIGDIKILVDVKSAKNSWSRSYKSRWEETLEGFEVSQHLRRIGEFAWICEDLEAYLEELGEDFLVDNFLQLNLYACSSFFKNRDLDFCSILKYCKNDSRIYELRFKPNMNLFNKIKEKYQKVLDITLTEGPEAVPCECKFGGIKAAFATYKKACFNDDALQAWLKEEYGTKVWPTDLLKINAPELITHFESYEEKLNQVTQMELLEKDIVTALINKKIAKIKLPNGNIYRTQYLKGPYPKAVLRRTKL